MCDKVLLMWEGRSASLDYSRKKTKENLPLTSKRWGLTQELDSDLQTPWDFNASIHT